MFRRVSWITASALALAAIAWWFWPRAAPHTPTTAPAASLPLSGDASDLAAPARGRPDWFPFETLLLPHEDGGASPETVGIGIGRVSPDQARAYERWVLSGEEGAGPTEVSELAQIEQWLRPPTAVREDGTVVVGPMHLPWADRFDLRARSSNPLISYSASFTAKSSPGTVAPTRAAGLTVVHSPQPGIDARVLFRRVEEASDAARWQTLMTEQAPELLAAFDEAALQLNARTQFAPLPPGALDLVLQVNGVEAERKRVDLIAGEWTEARFDEVSQAVARAVAVDLELTFVVAHTTDGIEGITATWHAERGDQPRLSDATGTAQFPGVDRQRLQRFTLQFPKNESVPIWPETQPLELTLDDPVDETSSRAIIRKTIALTPLRWLDVRTGDFPVPVHRQGGNPYPIFVLQQERDGQWLDVAADYFLPTPGGLAVSVQQSGRYRVMALRSPWSVRHSSVATVAPQAAARTSVDLLPSAGHRVEVTVLREGVPVPNAPIALRGPARGLPGATAMTDATGRLILEDATVPELRLEVPGYLAATVDLQSGVSRVELSVDSEATGD